MPARREDSPPPAPPPPESEPAAPPSEDPTIAPWMLTAGKLLGLSPVQTRWRLLALHRRWRSFRREMEPASRRFEHLICGRCGALVPREQKRCGRCDEAVASPVARALAGVGLSLPSAVTASAAMGASMIVIYGRMLARWPGQGLVSWSTEALLTHGALWPPAVLDPHSGWQPWRLATAAFVHIGVWHIFFNLAALSQAGSLAEEIYGRGRMVFLFVLTAVAASLASAVFQPDTVTAGASGGLMGLIGLLAGWGHRDATSAGRRVRDQMLKWAAYTMIFGFVIGANNVAHAGGFAAGALVGVAFDPRSVERTKRSALAGAMGVVGGLAAAACFALAMFPPAPAEALAREVGAQRDAYEPVRTEDDDERWRPGEGDLGQALARQKAFLSHMDRACQALAAGRADEARAVLHDFEPDGEPPDAAGLAMTCEWIAGLRRHCDAFRRGGVTAVRAADPKAGEGFEEDDYAEQLEMWCVVTAPPKAGD